MTASVSVRRDTPSATLRIENPDRRNALTPGIVDQLLEAFEDFHGEQGVRGIILTGGGECFCSGTDLHELSQQIAAAESDRDIQQQWHTEVSKLLELITGILRFPKPVVAAVNGVAAGTGLALALSADFVIGGDSSSYALPESRRGLMAGLAAPLLGFRAGNSLARRMLLLGQGLDAAGALAAGLIDEQVPDDIVWARAHELVTQLAHASPSSQLMAKQLCNETIGEILFTQLANGAANMAAARITDAARRGVDAFVNKRKVDWGP